MLPHAVPRTVQPLGMIAISFESHEAAADSLWTWPEQAGY